MFLWFAWTGLNKCLIIIVIIILIIIIIIICRLKLINLGWKILIENVWNSILREIICSDMFLYKIKRKSLESFKGKD